MKNKTVQNIIFWLQYLILSYGDKEKLFPQTGHTVITASR